MVITIREKIFLRMKELGVKNRAVCVDLNTCIYDNKSLSL